MNDCKFCKIVDKTISAYIVYEDKWVTAFLDKHPINPGHLLVIPKYHAPNYFRLEQDIYIKLMVTVKLLSEVIDSVVKPKKVGLIAAGFDVSHTHIHIIPMNNYHDITSKSMLEGIRSNPTDTELKEMSKKIKNSKQETPVN